VTGSPQLIYDRLWDEASNAFDRNAAQLDPFLANRQSDRRRGLTLLAQPDDAVRARVQQFLDELRAVAPGQYFYQPSEFHVTVLSVIPGSDSWPQAAKRLPEYLAALDTVLARRPAFSVVFRGVTASPDAVLVQGFPADDTLARLRDDLRAALAERGLAENLDRRYKLATAHMTVARFFTTMADWQRLKSLLSSNRNRDFGAIRFGALQLIEGNWYASADSVRTVREFPLA
jgi:2'-5' RNA ligase